MRGAKTLVPVTGFRGVRVTLARVEYRVQTSACYQGELFDGRQYPFTDVLRRPICRTVLPGLLPVPGYCTGVNLTAGCARESFLRWCSRWQVYQVYISHSTHPQNPASHNRFDSTNFVSTSPRSNRIRDLDCVCGLRRAICKCT